MSAVEIQIDEKLLETFGTGTLLGAIYKQHGSLPEKVNLIFPMTTMNFRRKNDGPKHIVMSEVVPFHLIEDVLSLIRDGVDVTICSDESLEE